MGLKVKGRRRCGWDMGRSKGGKKKGHRWVDDRQTLFRRCFPRAFPFFASLFTSPPPALVSLTPTPIIPVQHPYPTAERIWRAHVPYKRSSLLYLPRILQDLLDVSNPYTTRIAIIDILAKESQRVLAIQKSKDCISQHTSASPSTTFPRDKREKTNKSARAAAMQLVSDEIAGMGVIALTDVSGYASQI
ncbi:MAG: hypothetical protein BYD32DRAFT_432890 [Podila humilis]|nr:MAG: hypothetical protein BYD32DRAFT_432890 [Podila humilis]